MMNDAPNIGDPPPGTPTTAAPTARGTACDTARDTAAGQLAATGASWSALDRAPRDGLGAGG
jgi:hypothetical protein